MNGGFFSRIRRVELQPKREEKNFAAESTARQSRKQESDYRAQRRKGRQEQELSFRAKREIFLPGSRALLGMTVLEPENFHR
jgi:hypothetical protein